MTIHLIDGHSICDWDSFHDVFAKEFGFPPYYGRNMNAWVDCIDDIDDGGTIATLLISNAKHLKTTNPEIYEALIECSAFVNWRHVSEGGQPILALAFHE
jgi:RNAse (barnase) inhibitor barstar